MSSKLHNLQALRGVACLLVVFYHVALFETQTGFTPRHALMAPFAFFGYAGVELFFVISGFIITWVHFDHLGKPTALPGYAFKRFWRIYPLYWFCWLAVLLQLGVFQQIVPPPAEHATLREARALLLLPHPGELPLAASPHLPQAWTLGYEIMFYALFGLFLLLPRRAFLPAVGAWFLATAAALLTGRPVFLDFYANLPFLPPVLGFLLGCLAAAAIRNGRTAGARAGLVAAVGVVALGAVLNYLDGTTGYTLARRRFLCFGVPSALFVYGLTARERDGARVLPGWLRSAGDASYSIYLTHVAMFFLVRTVTTKTDHNLFLPHLGWVALMIGASLGGGYACHYAVERPLLACVRRRKRAAPAPGRERTGVPAERRAA